HPWVSVPRDQRTPGADEIEVTVSIGVEHLRTCAARDEQRRAADRPVCAHRGIDASGNHAAGALVQLGGAQIPGLAQGVGPRICHESLLAYSLRARPTLAAWKNASIASGPCTAAARSPASGRCASRCATVEASRSSCPRC